MPLRINISLKFPTHRFFYPQVLTCPRPSAAALRRPRTACTLRWPGEARLEGTELPDCELDRLLINGEADHERCSGSGLLGRSWGELRGLVKGLTGRWLFDASTLTSTLAPCRFLWKNRAREKLDFELSGLRGRNDVRLTSSSDILVLGLILRATSLLTPCVFSLSLSWAFQLRIDKPLLQKTKQSSGEISFDNVIRHLRQILWDSVRFCVGSATKISPSLQTGYHMIKRYVK